MDDAGSAFPETQPVLSCLSTDLFDICLALTEWKLSGLDFKWKSEATICVILAARDYPGDYHKGDSSMGLTM